MSTQVKRNTPATKSTTSKPNAYKTTTSKPTPKPYTPYNSSAIKPTAYKPPTSKATTAYKPPTKAMAPQNQGWLARTTQAATSGVGNFAGGIVNAAGNGVAGAGRGAGASVTNTSRNWGDSVRSYGNYIKDVSGAQGSRAPTGKNPLGLSSTPQGAKAVGKATPGPSARKGTASNPLGL